MFIKSNQELLLYLKMSRIVLNIFYQLNDLDSIQVIVNKELKKLSIWLNANRLSLNITKTNFVTNVAYIFIS